MNKRVLIIGYWYPDFGMPAARLRRIARLLPRHGWEPVVLTHPWDLDAVTDLPAGVRVQTAAAFDLTAAFGRIRRLFSRQKTVAASSGEPRALPIGLTSRINRWIMLPDKQAPWYRSAVRAGRQLLNAEHFDAIFATLDPRTSLLVATRLSCDTGVPAILEYRDLWVGNPYYHIGQPAGIHRLVHRRLERKVLSRAARVSTVCRGIADYLASEYESILKGPVALNYNFFDPEEYPPIQPTGARPFTISYMGNLYADRRPHCFFEGLRVFIDRAALQPGSVRFRWAGAIAGVSDLAEVLDRTRIRPYIQFLDKLPHRAAITELTRSDAALILQAPNDTIHIPGKLYEAMGAGVPVLALANPCEVTEIIDRCHAGIVARYDPDSVADALTTFYRLHKAGQRWTFNDAERAKFSANAVVGSLAHLFDDVAAGQTSHGAHEP